MKRLTRAKAIREKCIDCCCGDKKEIRECTLKDCALWRYRMNYEVNENNKRVVP